MGPTTGNGNGNGKLGWILSAIGIPLATIIAWVFGAGQSKADLDMVKACATRIEAVNAQQDNRLTRLETVYERTGEDIREIKSMLRKQQ